MSEKVVKISKKENKMQRLYVELEIRNKMIGQLLKIIAENKIELPDFIVTPLEVLYKDKINVVQGEKNE